MMTFYNGCLTWLNNERPLEIVNGQSMPILGVFEGPTYLNSPWSISI